MSFFTSSLALTLASALDVSVQEKDDKHQVQIDDFSAIQKELLRTESVRPMVQGVVAIKVKSVNIFPLLGDTKLRNIYFTVVNRNYSKKSRVLLNEGVLSWNETHHFAVNVVRNVFHPFNAIKISLMGFSSSQPELKVEIGQVGFHLHSIVKAAPISGTYFLWHNNSQIGNVEVEFTFSYGRFGYGYSYQLKEEDTNPSEKISYSLFPRINPPYSQCEKGEAIIEFRCNRVPAVLKDCDPIEFDVCKEIKSLDKKEEQYCPDRLLKEMNHLNDIKSQYFSTKDRVSRILFLSNYLSNARNTQETVLESSSIPQEPELSSKQYLKYVISTEEHLSRLKSAENKSDLVKKSPLYMASKAAVNLLKKGAEADAPSAVNSQRVGAIKKTNLVEEETANSPKSWKFINISQKPKVHPSNKDDSA